MRRPGNISHGRRVCFNNMKKTFLISTALAATLFATSSIALQARPNNADQPAGHERAFKPGQLKAKLGLTNDQAAKIKTEFLAQKEPLKEKAKNVHTARSHLRDAIQSGAPEADLRTAAAAIGTAEGDLAVVRSALFARISPILTPEQLTKLREMQAKR